MLTRASKFKLRLLGPFGLQSPDRLRISIPSRRGAALIAMLAVSKDGVRTRGWLQSQRWGSCELKEANLAFTQRRIHWASCSPDCAERICRPGSCDRGCHRAARGPGQERLGQALAMMAQRSIAPC